MLNIYQENTFNGNPYFLILFPLRLQALSRQEIFVHLNWIRLAKSGGLDSLVDCNIRII
jgi:hypothetical protein